MAQWTTLWDFTIQVHHCSSIDSIFLHQRRYIQDILLCFGLQDVYDISTPANTHAKLHKISDPTDPPVNVPY